MGVNSIGADNLSAIVSRILNKKEAFISGRFLRLCSSSLIVLLACVASVSVGFGSKERARNRIFGVLSAWKMGREPKMRKRGWERGRKETLADKPLDFEHLRSPANRARD